MSDTQTKTAPPTATEASETPEDQSPSRVRQLLSGNRVIWVLAVVALVSLAAGIVLSRFIQSPADAASKVAPPAAGLITVPIENRVIANDVTLRADVLYDESVEVKIDTSAISGAAVVTGRVPEVGTVLDPGSIILELAGRPVIALPGDLPAYRTLRVGVSGPDVLQLKATLAAMEINPGNVESDKYDAATAAAVDKLYLKVGYTSPPASDEDAAAVDGARSALTSAKDSLAAAEAALTAASAGPSVVDQMTQNNLVAAAQRALDAAVAARDYPELNPETGQQLIPATTLQIAVDDAQDNLNLAIAQRDEAFAGAGTTTEKQARDSARTAVTEAQTALNEALEKTLTALPAGEVAFFSNLPRRVDAVSVARGQTVSSTDALMTVSGASLVIKGSVAPSDAELLTVGLAGTFTLPDGSTSTATVSEVKPADKAADDKASDDSKTARFTVTFALEGLTDEQIGTILGTNIKITVPVNSTGEEVLAVPSAALTAGPGGETRIERTVDSKTSELINVTTGLAAGGYVQILSSDKPLAESDLVVVGK